MSTPANFGWMKGKIGGFLDWVWNRKPVPLERTVSPPPLVSDQLPPPLPSPSTSDAAKEVPLSRADVERGLHSAPTKIPSSTSEAKIDERDKPPPPPFHDRMSDGATSIAGCLVALAFVLLLKAPTGAPPILICAYCYFAMLDLFAGGCIYYLHVARAPSTDVARIQATAAAVGLVAAVMNALVLCYFFLEAAKFWGLALALLSSVVGFCGFVVAAGCRD